MADLRVGVLCFEGGLDAWQQRVFDRLTTMHGVQVVRVLTCQRTTETDFVLPRRMRKHSTPVDASMSGESAGDWDMLVNLTASPDPLDLARKSLRLAFDEPRGPGRSEATRGAAVSAMRLMLYAPGVGERIIASTVTKTASSASRNAQRVLNESAVLFARGVNAVRQGGEQALSPTDSEIAYPSATDRLRQRVSRSVSKLLFRADWTLGLSTKSVGHILASGEFGELRPVKGLPRTRFFADPFPLRVHKTGMTILAENASLKPPHKGRISKIRLDRNGDVSEITDAMSLKEHLSFPFLFREANDVFCLPERHEAGNLTAFRQEDGRWTEDAVLLEGVAAVDPVLFARDGKWWLFCGDRAHEDTTHLFLFHADHWRGPWKPHPLNPVKSDVRSSRPAGAIVVADGRLLRPAQDCSARYGGAISVQEIETLSETAYSEREAFRIDPQSLGRRYVGVHTINGMGDLTIVDLLERRLFFT